MSVADAANRLVQGGYAYRSVGTAINWVDVAEAQSVNLDSFSQSRAVEYAPIIDLRSICGTSALRDFVTATGEGWKWVGRAIEPTFALKTCPPLIYRQGL
jgi:hypothetical protein